MFLGWAVRTGWLASITPLTPLMNSHVYNGAK
jgi:hypothetical protein